MFGRLLTVPLLLLLALVGSSGRDASAGPVSIARCQVPVVTPLIIELTAASRAPGASGVAELVFSGSPFAAHVTPDGRYVYDVRLRTEGLRSAQGVYIAWIARTDLSEAINLGPLGEDLTAAGTVDWNQFLVFVTLEEKAGGQTWHGPIFLSGISPSSRMHTMAGHGIFEQHTALC